MSKKTVKAYKAAIARSGRATELVTKGEWSEDAHPRDDKGRFEGSGGDTKGSTPAHPSLAIPGEKGEPTVLRTQKGGLNWADRSIDRTSVLVGHGDSKQEWFRATGRDKETFGLKPGGWYKGDRWDTSGYHNATDAGRTRGGYSADGRSYTPDSYHFDAASKEQADALAAHYKQGTG